MEDQRGDDAGGDRASLGNGGERAWIALLADLCDADRELLWSVGQALLARAHGERGRIGDPSVSR